MNFNKLFESILDDIAVSDVKNNASDRLSKDIQIDNDDAFDERNIPKTTRFTQMLSFMAGCSTGIYAKPGLIKQELDSFIEYVSDIFESSPEVTDYAVCVLTADESDAKIDPRIHITTQEDCRNFGHFTPFRLNFNVCWNRPLKNPRTLRLIFQAFYNTIRKTKTLTFDNICCRLVENNVWTSKSYVRVQNLDNYISIQAGLSEFINDPDSEFWVIYNLERFLCPTPKLFYDLSKQFGDDFDNAKNMYRQMLWAVTYGIKQISFYGDDYMEEYQIDECILSGAQVTSAILNDYNYAIVCAKGANTSNVATRDTYCQISDAMGNDVVQNAIRDAVNSGRAIICKTKFLRTNIGNNMCLCLMEPIWNPESKVMMYFGIIFIRIENSNDMSFFKLKKISGRTLDRLVSSMWKALSKRPAGLTIKGLTDELRNAKREFAYRPAQN